jgi:hypothetical protein
MGGHQLCKVPAATLTTAQYFLFPQYEKFAYLVTRVATVFKYRHIGSSKKMFRVPGFESHE